MVKKEDSIATQGRITVTTHFPREGEDNMEVKELEVRKFQTEPAFVRAGYGLTINLGNYESARVDVAVTLPCYVEEIDGALKTAWEIAEREVQEQAKGAKAYGKAR